ncbi:hydrogenase iron-sulfur subunit [Desulfohalobiaceae bacterium Ax17]|uniref:FAD-dependent oxidoreductase n=1 Tax=Desulfovulcanus ferrireducens TaxID=2831190 RepID=UPI00207BC548|nr:FAD-dependent oxidoreductase [Desulfovulcanus ferrireducens]MBT8762768.1 hydrogenase iron-sulfur subunit [Desulfovulcanus ferrireducens]
MADKKIGVYICTGCEIGKNLNLEQLTEYIDDEACPALIKTLPFLCGKEGVAEIQKDIQEEGINAVCVAACSPRIMWDVFDFGPDVFVERANIRELAVWSYKEPDLPPLEETELDADPLTMMAQDYIRMAVSRLEKIEKPEPEIPEINKTILVVGGGFTGLNAALNAANTGYDVVLVEKEDKLGGFAAQLYKQLPSNYPYTDAEEPTIDELIAQVENHDKIKVLTSANIESISGAPGLYEAKVKTGDDEQELKIGAVVLATGWKPYDASKLEPLGYGKFKNVVTNVEFEKMAKEGKLTKPSDGQKVESVAFIQCAGQRDPEHLPYCSSVCCMVSLKQAKYVREKDDNAKAFIFYKDMRTPGVYENYYKAAQDDPGIFLTKSEIEEIVEDSDGKIVIRVKDTLLGESLEVKVDLLVLATGMVPTTAEEAKLELEYLEKKSQSGSEDEKKEEGQEEGDDPLFGKLVETSCLKLQYRQGPTFPELMLFDGFADSNYICFPYETRRTGIYAAGCVRQPMNLNAAKEDATGAALKAIQCIESANRGVAVHPRSGDMSYPKFNFVRCTQCKRCTEECPFGALDDDEKGTPKPNPTRCRRCGTCMGACPERVISFDNYSVTIVNDMIQSIEVPDDEEEGGYRILVLVCENDAYPALDMAAMRGKKWSAYVRFIPVRCLGSVNTQWVAEAMSKGLDGVLLMGCKFGDDYQCHFVKGSELCNRRMENIAETLEKLQVEPERVKQVQVAIDEYDKIPQIIDEFVEEVESYGPNPFKGF